MKKNPRRATSGKAIVAFLSLIFGASAQALTLPDAPLVADTGEPPNIMFVLDTSKSMRHMVVASPYSSSTSYGSCSNSNSLSNKRTYYLSVAADGTAQIIYKSGSSTITTTWANDTNNRCFNPSKTYDARIHTDSDYYTESLSGNYLNWYFSNATQTGAANFGSGAEKRSDVFSRLETMQDVLVDLLNNTITSGRVGLVSFEGLNAASPSIPYRGVVEKGLLDVTANSGANLSDLTTAVKSLDAEGGTPLASTLAQTGRYFVEGKNQSLAISSSNVTGPMNAYTLFADEPRYENASDKPNSSSPAIENECQSNYVIALSDGEPSPSDTNLSSYLSKWDDNSISTASDFDDVAAALYDTDLRPDLTGNQNITTHVVGFDLSLTLLNDAAAAGGGNYYSANDTSSLKTSLSSALSAIKAQVGSIASVAFNSSNLDTGSAIFQAIYNTGNWTGTLSALPLDNAGAIGSASWEAGNLLDAANYSQRDIFTYDSTANSGAGEGIPFDWSSLNTSQKNDLRQSVDQDGDGNSAAGNGAVDDDDAESLLDFIRGDRSNEGNGANDYRTRGSILGDIVNSTPIFVGKPEMNWPDFSYNNLFGASGSEYSTYKNSSTVQGRTPVIYVGANDGMLHGFNANLSGTGAGQEVFAYIPGALFSSSSGEGLHYLAEQNYAHKFYVDLTPVVSDVYIKRSTSGSRAWRTILLGGLRAGGRGLFALDVSNPSEFSNPSNNADDIVLWEFTSNDDSDLGYTYGLPTIAMMANGKWAAIVGNGYNSSGGFAKLFIIYIEEGIDGWTAGEWVELDTGVGSDNGLSTPRVVDLDGDSVVDLVYAGDLKGNMWAFNVSSSNESDWSNASNIRKLFTAQDSSGNPQPITSAPTAAINPNSAITSSASTPNLLLMFGTGKYIEDSDNSTSTGRMTYYSVWDKGTNSLLRTNLASREVVSSSDLRTVNGSAIDWNTQYGWYMDLVNISSSGGTATDEGERVVSDSLLRRSVLFFNTIIPNSTNCAVSGEGWLMSLDYDSGLAPSFAVFDANGDGTIDTSDIGFMGSAYKHGIPSKSGILGEQQYTPGTDGTVDTREVNVGLGNSEGRMSWNERIRD